MSDPTEHAPDGHDGHDGHDAPAVPGGLDPRLAELADRVARLVTERGADLDAEVEANVRATRTRHGLTRFANSSIHQHVAEDTTSVTLVLAVDGRTSSSSTTATSDEALTDLVDATIASARRQPVDPSWPGATPPAEVHGTGHVDAATADAGPDDRARLVRAFVDAGPQLRAAGFVDTAVDEVAFASTAGQRCAGAATRATLDAIHQTARSAGSAHGTSAAIGELDATALGELAADRARRSADFVDVDPGTFEVVLGPEAVSTVLTFLSVYGLNAKAHLDGSSFARIGEQQFDPAITVVDDPLRAGAIGLPFDAEGSPRRRTPLIEAGVTRALAHDRRTALRAGSVTTGSAIPGGEAIGAVPSAVVLGAGTTPASELVASVERGLLITEFHYVRVLDPKSQLVTGLTRNGTFLIEDGEVVGAVGNLRFTESFVEAFGPGRVRAVGDDPRFASGEFGPGMVVCPSVHLGAWTFTGGARG